MYQEEYKQVPLVKKSIVIFLLVAVVFVVSGIGLLVKPLPADAVWGAEAESKTFYEWIEDLPFLVIENIYNHVIWPIIITIVLKGMDLASDMPTWAGSLDSLFNFVIDVALAEAINTILGINICGDLSMNLKLALFDYAIPDFIPDCTLSMAKENFKNMQKAGFSNFAISTQQGGDMGAWFDVSGEAIDTKDRWEQGLLHKLTAGSGFLGISTCDQGENNPLLCQDVLPGTIQRDVISESYNMIFKKLYDVQPPWWQRYIYLGEAAILVLFMSAFNKGLKWLLKKTFEARESSRSD